MPMLELDLSGKRILFLVIAILTITGLTACDGAQPTQSNTPTPSSTPAPSATATSTLTPTSTPTETPSTAPGVDMVLDCAAIYPGIAGCLQHESIVGGRLAFVDDRDPFAGRPVVVEPAAGNATTLGDHPAELHGWSPSGAYLLTTQGVYRPDGERVRDLDAAPGCHAPAWAPADALTPAGDWLLCQTAEGGLEAHALADDATVELLPPETLTAGGGDAVLLADAGLLAWTPTMDHLAGEEQWEQNLYVRPAESNAAPASFRLSDDIRESYYHLISWVPGTRRLLAGRGMLSASLWVDGVPLIAIDVDTGEIRELDVVALLTPEAYAWHPSRPGLLALAAGGGRFIHENKRLALLEVETGDLTYLTGEEEAAFAPAWSPDGTQLAYAAVPASPIENGDGETLELQLEGRAIYLIDPETGERQPVTTPGEAIDGWPHWSVDGEHLFYTRQRAGQTDVRVIAPTGTTDELLLTGLPDPICYYGGCNWDRVLAYTAVNDLLCPPAASDAEWECRAHPKDWTRTCTAAGETAWRCYEDRDYGFALSYPPNWQASISINTKMPGDQVIKRRHELRGPEGVVEVDIWTSTHETLAAWLEERHRTSPTLFPVLKPNATVGGQPAALYVTGAESPETMLTVILSDGAHVYRFWHTMRCQKGELETLRQMLDTIRFSPEPVTAEIPDEVWQQAVDICAGVSLQPSDAEASESAFPRTAAWFKTLGNEYPPPTEELVSAFSADIIAYLEKAITPTKSLESQQDSLARMAEDLPSQADRRGQVVPVNLDAATEAELFVIPRLNGGPLLYVHHAAEGWQAAPVPVTPPGEQDAVAAAPNLWPQSAEAGDVTGDGQPEVVTVHTFSGGSNWREHPQILRWNGEGFDVLFRAELVNWAGPSQWRFEPAPSGHDKQDIVISYPIFLPSRSHKFDPHPEGVQRWRWDANVEHYVLWATAVRTPFPPIERLIEPEEALQVGDYAAALQEYQTVLTDEAWQEEYRAMRPREEALTAWLDFIRLRAALCQILLNQPEGVGPLLDEVQTDDLRPLARAFYAAYGGDADLVTALSAYAQAISERTPREGVGAESGPAGAAWGHRPWPYTVLGLLNAEDGTALLDEAINEKDLPVQVQWADMDSDGQDEVIWLSDAEWRVVWVGWRDGSGVWRATGLVAGDDLALLDVTPAGETGSGAVSVRYYGEERTLHWDGELKMARVPVDERPAEWPVMGVGNE
ncbi:MAG: hypothetical protein ACP5JG_12700 [Anaerolineae bacterium]